MILANRWRHGSGPAQRSPRLAWYQRAPRLPGMHPATAFLVVHHASDDPAPVVETQRVRHTQRERTRVAMEWNGIELRKDVLFVLRGQLNLSHVIVVGTRAFTNCGLNHQ